MTQRFDAIIVGAGQAGPALAGRLTAAGRKVAVVERHLFGGTCVNTGCTPTKTMVASAQAAHLARRGEDFGFSAGNVAVDLARVKARKDGVVSNSRRGIEGWLGGMDGCTVFRGHARFTSPTTISVGEQLLEAPQIFLNVGGRAAFPPMPGLDKVEVLTNTGILGLDVLPRHLVVVGGSYIGLEFGQMFRRFGCEVTIVEKGSRLIGREDEDVSKAVEGILLNEGIKLRLDAECIHFAPHPDGIAVGVDCTSGEREVIGSHVLLAVGRRPNTDDLGLEAAGVAVDPRGYIIVDDQLRTNVPGIWALGDCNGRGAFTHTAYNDFEIVAANLLDDDPRRVSDRTECYALYIDPPLGRVGMSEKAVRASGRKALIGMRPMTRVSRAIEKGDTQGFIKILVDAKTQQFLGASILGVGGDEVVHGILDLIYAKAPASVLQRSVPIHPNVSELLPTVVGELKPLE
ncbi:pyruvate/2-oxoglutarate dehydrogenase complex dihydrolipoamide dehydrogenase (E3) component [Kaistia hirudinis]|uniref:Pyruvate/2-oxoglutarate dehydrogenase complex dihydrolipoamide dehydrogenase (E3) component n=1 Tax=Kaistia hirudinis TaxID=1293440 RepID=A0A840APD4_9HYPH|nr:FAD-containing oxidoreductase [Kaistia hirudinis]MBB3932149.1 pyruvate/2-oxoglutarate dehydrogenase complex dihydrolipoamide dehydrogenase (E3) component [Kaistia hirudinis]